MKQTTFPLTIALLITSFLQPAPASASDPIMQYTKEKGKSGDFLYSVFNNRWLMKKDGDGKRIAITGLSPDAKGDIFIPESLDGLEVYGIDDNAFTSSKGVKSIFIPKTVRFLQAGALSRCEGLESITVDDDHPEFASEDGIMFDKKKTTLLVAGSGLSGHYEVPDSTTKIGQAAFARCTNLVRVTIPESVTDIGGRRGEAFLGCTKLERITIPETVTNIGQKSFQDCISLQKVTIPSKVTEIPFGLFWKCSNLTSVTLPDGITSIGNYAFADCPKVTLKAFPKSLTKIGAYAFKGCISLKGLTLPEGVVDIGNGAFRGVVM